MTQENDQNKIFKVFQITDTLRHRKGHTIYKVICKEISKHTAATISEVVIWKRYNDFKKLHKMMLSLHQGLYMKGKFPIFAKAKLFGRYEQEVIEERKKSALQLLEFVNNYPVLLSSVPFVSFFENGETISSFPEKSPNQHILDEPPIIIQETQEDQQSQGSQEGAHNLAEGALLGGVWNYRKPVDDISYNSEDFTDDDGTIFTDSDSMLSTPLPSSEFSFFDPLYDKSFASNENASEKVVLPSRSNSNDSALEDFKALKVTPNSDQVFNFPDVLNDVIKVNLPTDKTENNSSKTDLSVHSDSIDITEFDPLHNASKDFTDGPVQDESSGPVLSPLSPLTPSVGITAPGIQKYLFEAANIISQAQQHEVDMKFRLAFQCYKSGVSKLLSGVQNEKDSQRRDAVRRKISHYMRRAEELYCYHLADDPTDDKIWNNEALVQVFTFNAMSIVTIAVLLLAFIVEYLIFFRVISVELIDSSDSKGVMSDGKYSPYAIKTHAIPVLESSLLNVNLHLKSGSLISPISELKQYKVLGIIDKVSLVLDPVNQNTYVVKALYKSSHATKLSVPSIVPTEIPFMIKLHRVFETDYALFLLLEHASAGRLWNYVSEFMRTSPCSPSRELNCPTSKLISPFKTGKKLAGKKAPANVYSGKQLLAENEVDGHNLKLDKEAKDISMSAQTELYDEDLCAEADYPSSYVQLFTNYASTRAHDSDTGLAKCNIKPSITADCDFSCDNLNILTKKNIEEKIVLDSNTEQSNCTYDTISSDDAINSNNVQNTVKPDFSPLNLTTVAQPNIIEDYSESDDLIHNARKLLTNVNHTLQKSKTDLPAMGNDEIGSLNQSRSVNEAKKEKPSIDKPRSLSFVSASQPKRRSSSQMHEPFTSPADSPLRSRQCSTSYGGSCENLFLHQNGNNRCFTALFKQMDEMDQLSAGYLPEKNVKSWAAEMVMAVSKLHIMGIICRDLNPDNILLGERGHIKLTYFSQWNCVENQVDWSAVEKLYCAPEMDGIQPFSTSADWWSLGALLYELLTGRTLVSCHPSGINSHTQLFLPNHLSKESKSLLEKLLTFNPVERLGSGLNGLEDIKAHPFFSEIDWNAYLM
ncbi:Ribosomal protein S6 kinase delta-1 [Nymphon striatum]|nr:Ribosomal protein S6 kinase delta-1 [Nymphon striatum]